MQVKSCPLFFGYLNPSVGFVMLSCERAFDSHETCHLQEYYSELEQKVKVPSHDIVSFLLVCDGDGTQFIKSVMLRDNAFAPMIPPRVDCPFYTCFKKGRMLSAIITHHSSTNTPVLWAQ
jgi:hypothetical protein